ncbi:MAG: hypothetical protein ACLF0G_00105 [Candidatus Brocadiia bacterium]
MPRPSEGDQGPPKLPVAPRRRGLLALAALLAIGAGCVGLLLALGALQRTRDKLEWGSAEAEAAYRKALRAYRREPDDLASAIAALRAVSSRYGDTRWGRRAEAQLRELQWLHAEAARDHAEEALERELPALGEEVHALLAEDRFAQALRRLEAFADQHPIEAALCEVASLRCQVRTAAREHYARLAEHAEAAIERKDYAAARQTLRRAASLGFPELARRAGAKLAEVDSREDHAEQWAKWDELKARARRAARVGGYDRAFELLDKARATARLDNIASLVAKERKALEEAKRQAAQEALAAYKEHSREAWLLFLERRYAKAEALIGRVWAKPRFGLAAKHIRADLQAVELLRAFWAAVERGVAAREGKSFVVRDLCGTVVGVEGGKVTLRGEDEEGATVSFTVPLRELETDQAVACAELGDDPTSQRALALFLLAEARDLGTAERAAAALRSAGGPFLDLYQERLASTRRHILEREAREAWQRLAGYLDAFVDEARARRLHALLNDFVADYGHTTFATQVADQVETLRQEVDHATGGPQFTLRVDVKTASDGPLVDEATRVAILLNGDPAYRRCLKRLYYDDFTPGSTATYHFKFFRPMPRIRGITLAVEGPGAWKPEQVTFQLFRKRKKSRPRRFTLNQVLTTESCSSLEETTDRLWLAFTPKWK